jgi:NADPH-dependent 2,4-dienoyl-CoA reductase/sulfur reductase-like enzyme
VLGEHELTWDRLIARSPEEHERRGIDVRLQTEVTAIDVDRREVQWRDLASGREGIEGFDRLVYATGAGARRPAIEGLEHGCFLYSPEQAKALGERLPAVRRAVVAGGGYIGLEMAEALRRRGAETVLVTRAPQVMRPLDPDIAAHVEAALVSEGVEVRTNTELLAIEQRGDAYTAITSAGEIVTDMVVIGLGSVPNAELAEAAGIALGETGAVAVNHAQRTNIEGIYAAGDCAESWHRVMERWVNYHLGTIANKAGRVAGLNVCGREASFPGVVGTAITRICGAEVARTGLSEREAALIGMEVKGRVVETSTRAGYMEDAGTMWTKLIVEASSGRVGGGQIVGDAGSGKRIDTVATAVTAGMTVQDIVDLDLSYAPPFSPVWDPVQTAGRVLL